MRRRSTIGLLAVVLAAAGCSAHQEVDLTTAATQASEFERAALAEDATLGSGTLVLRPEDSCDGDGAEVPADPPRANADAVRVNAHLVEGDGAVLVIVLRGESG